MRMAIDPYPTRHPMDCTSQESGAVPMILPIPPNRKNQEITLPYSFTLNQPAKLVVPAVTTMEVPRPISSAPNMSRGKESTETNSKVPMPARPNKMPMQFLGPNLLDRNPEKRMKRA